jgi:hypothetical protein
MIGLFEYFQHWDMMHDILLSQEDNQHSWRLEGSGQFTSKSAYRAFFNGSTTFEPWLRIWKTWAPGKCKVFLWLAIHYRCWTADRLQKRGEDSLTWINVSYATRKWRLSHFMCVCAPFLVQDLGSTGPLYHVSLDVVITLLRLGGRRPANVLRKAKKERF